MHRFSNACTSLLSSNANATARESSAAEIEEFIRGFTSGEIPDYQASAWAMAVFFRGMTARGNQRTSPAR